VEVRSEGSTNHDKQIVPVSRVTPVKTVRVNAEDYGGRRPPRRVEPIRDGDARLDQQRALQASKKSFARLGPFDPLSSGRQRIVKRYWSPDEFYVHEDANAGATAAFSVPR